MKSSIWLKLNRPSVVVTGNFDGGVRPSLLECIMKKKVRVKRHVRVDGTVVNAHDREITNDGKETLGDRIKREKREAEQRDALSTFFEEK